jgi:choline dehydrogenase-like flavoprotein
MIKNFYDIQEDDIFDYCVIGSGPAGITLSLKLAKNNKKILLVEAGGINITQESQMLYEGQVIGDEYLALDTCRLRYFGGTSNHWSGVCRTFDASDFDSKESFKENKWPINKSNIDKYIDEASNILEIPKIPKDMKSLSQDIKTIHFVNSPPVRFKDKYFNEINDSKNIFLSLNTNCINLETNGHSITGAILKNRIQKKIKSKNFILATGGIENSRLLLWSNELSNYQVVKNYKSLGRYWMDHPNFDVGEAVMFNKSKHDYFSNYFAITDKKKADLGILNARIGFSENNRSLKQSILDLKCMAPKLSNFLEFNQDIVCGSNIRAVWEQEPTLNNRIELSKEIDLIGVPKTNLYWKKTKKDINTIRKTLETFALSFVEQKLGRIKIYPFIESGEFPSNHSLASSHHIGGTRMSNDSNLGVVDENCKVHGQSNLYIMGSSIFPTGGYTNPTLPIIQFALRLSDHLLNKEI